MLFGIRRIRAAGWLAIGVIAASFTLSGCAEKPVTLDPAAARNVHSIAFVRHSAASGAFTLSKAQYETNKKAGYAGTVFGIIGWGVVEAAASPADGSGKAGDAIAAQKPDLEGTLEAALREDFTKRGYSFTTIAPPDREAPHQLVHNLDALHTHADAILDVLVAFARYSDIDTPDIDPQVALLVRLVDSKSKAILMRQNYLCWPSLPPKPTPNVVVLGNGYAYNSFFDIAKDPSRAVAGLNACVAALAQRVTDTITH